MVIKYDKHQISKDAKIYVGGSTTVQNRLFSTLGEMDSGSLKGVGLIGAWLYCVLCTVKAKKADKTFNKGIYRVS